MAQPSSETKYYEKTSGFATTKGQLYETKVSAWLFLRGINSGLHFQLGSNVKGAGALDDVVFKFKSRADSDTWTSFFIQLKHKEHSSVNRKMLTDPQGPFSLLTYFKSYKNIEKKMAETERKPLFDGNIDDSVFVIFTNAKPNKDLGEEHRGLERIDDFLGSGSGKVFKFNNACERELDNAVFDSLLDCATGGKHFLDRLFIFAGQPGEANFDNLIKIELEKAVGHTRDVDLDRLCIYFVENVKTWCEERRNVLLRESNLFVSARDRVIAETRSLFEVNLYKLDLVFEEVALLPLREVLCEEFPLVHVVSSEPSSQLTCTKLLQAFEGSSYLFLGSNCLLANQNAVLSEWGNGRHNTLIVSISNGVSFTDRSHLKQILELFKVAANSKKRLFVLTDETIESAYGFKDLKDTFQFSSLTSVSRNKFLSNTFMFQGYSISLETFLAQCLENGTDVISASFLVEMIQTGPKWSLGSVLADSDKRYLPRSLRPAEFYVSKSLFQETTLTQNISISNLTVPNIVDIFLQIDTSLSKAYVHWNLLPLPNLLEPDQTYAPVFTGPTFYVGKLTCSHVGLTSDKVSAFRIHPHNDVKFFGCFLFVFQGTSESDFNKLAMSHCSLHLFKMENEKLKLVRSEFNDDRLLQDHIYLLCPENLLDISERAMIVCGEPGMGKSTLVTHLAKMTKSAYPHLWVVLIALNHHTQLFAEGKHKDATGFLLAATQIKTPLQQLLFKLALQVTGNVVVVLDGFDEIAPTYVDHCCQLLTNLLETNVKKVWVTTRISVKDRLERHLSTPATRLSKLNKADQRGFLKCYWSNARDSALASGKEILSDKDLDDFIDWLLNTTTQSIEDWRNDFLGVPLQALIMAEVFVERVTSLSGESVIPDKLNWLKLLDSFVEKKLAVYVQDKLKIVSSDTNYDMHLNNNRSMYLTFHMEAALHLIFHAEYVKELQLKYFSGDFLDFFQKIGTGGNKTGFIDSISYGKAHFVHRVFAEYFVATWFADNLPEYAKFLEKNMYHAYRGAYVVPRFLCDLTLAKDRELHTAVLNGNVDEVKTLLAKGCDVNARDKGGRTALHLTAGFGSMEHVEVRHVEVLDLLVNAPGTDFNIKDELLNYTPLGYADANQYWVMIDKLLAREVDTKYLTTMSQYFNTENLLNCILSYDLDHLLEFCLNQYPDFLKFIMYELFEGSGHLANACNSGNLRSAKLLMKRGTNINGETQSLYASKYPPLLCASQSGNLEIVKLLVTSSKGSVRGQLCEVSAQSHPEFFSDFQSKVGLKFLESLYYVEPDFVNRKARHGRTALHAASEHGHADVVSFLIGHGADVESCDHDDETCLHKAAAKNHPGTVKVILSSVSEDKMLTFVNLGNIVKMTALHWAAKAGSTEIVRMLVNAGVRMAVDRYRQTPLMLAARSGHLEVVKLLVAALNGDSDGTGIRKTVRPMHWIDAKDKDGWTALSLAAMFGFGNVVTYLTEQGADSKRRDGPDSGMPKDHFEEDCYCYSHFVKYKGDTSTAQIIILAGNDNGNTALHTAAWKGYLEAVTILVKFTRMRDRNSKGETPLMLAAGNGHFYVVEYLLNEFGKVKYNAGFVADGDSETFLKIEFVNMEDCYGMTAAYRAARFGHECTVKLLIQHGAHFVTGGILSQNPLV